ncbi:hypothetical protein IY145_08365 [Methylosinus sp. H3A]|uniref:cytochrome oxidase putative small subunit CydP n=1 Tax=Methylosinus sp. H3A TaxID=2785786 RepID=UPI0018C2DD49|nr:cytochrome oxidase putative small subunit CydP [Methylosinus sp. H3A]MBG0809390.1 hypothetical protein [Methylosinus sp. H3A]
MSAIPTTPETSQSRLWREIAVALALKTVALALLYFLCFDASKRPQISPAAVAEKLFARDRG